MVKSGKFFENANLQVNSIIKMNCHIKKYVKGYVNNKDCIDSRAEDIGINRASQIQVIKNGEGISFKEFIEGQIKLGKYISNKYKIVIDNI